MDWYNQKTMQRMTNKIKISKTGCWVWQASLNHKGYGQVGYKDTMVRTHRLMYQLLIGVIPKGLQIDHLCRNRACCNPEHLEPVTPLENTKRSPIHDRNKTHCKWGHGFTPENTMIYKKTGQRACRICQRRRTKAYDLKIKQLKIFA